ncbi:MAG: fimbrial protein [Candidatus Cryptobacteroides sp.]
MKTQILVLAASAVLMGAACTKISNVEEIPAEAGEKTMTEVCFRVADATTKAIESTADEKAVKSVQFYVFESTGALEVNSGLLDNASSATLKCGLGTKRVVGIINAPEVTEVKNTSDLQNRLSNLSDNQRNKFVMLCDSTITLTGAQTSIDLKAKRIAAKITVKSVKNDFRGGHSVKVEEIYLINAAGDFKYLNHDAPTSWYNKMKYDTEVPALLCAGINGTSPAMNPGTSQNFSAKPMYCYPNNTETDSSSATWSPRFTRVVIKLVINGTQTCYYPLSLPGLKSNTAYEVNFILTRGGSSSPDIPVEIDNINYTVTVVDWENGGSITETI